PNAGARAYRVWLRPASHAFEHGIHVSGHPHRAPDLPHLAGAIYEERAPLDTHVLPTVVLLLHPDTIRLGQGLLGIGEERKREPVLLLEARVALEAVGAHADDAYPLGREAGQRVAEAASLERAAGSVVFR